MPTGFHPNTHLDSSFPQLTVELLRFFWMLESPFLQFSSFGFHIRNLLEARVIIASYNQPVRLLSPGLWLVGTTKVYSGTGADTVMESLHSKPLFGTRW